MALAAQAGNDNTMLCVASAQLKPLKVCYYSHNHMTGTYGHHKYSQVLYMY
jgi:beta-galactosidase/beta-glucuronidase